MRQILTFFVCFAAFAQTNPDTLATIRGKVVNRATGEPLAEAALILQPPQVGPIRPPGQSTFTSTTDGQGAYEFTAIAPGTYTLKAERSGFAPGDYAAPLTLEPGRDFVNIDFKLVPQGVIAGRVLDPDGDPVWADVFLLAPSFVNGKRNLVQAGSARTNDLGEYRVYGLAPGRYYLRAVGLTSEAVMIGHDASAIASTDRPFPTYYPSSLDQANARPIDVAVGDMVTGADIAYLRLPTTTIRGVITDASGLAGGRTYVSVITADNEAIRGTQTTVQPDGRFETRNVPVGSFALQAGKYFLNSSQPQNSSYPPITRLTARQPIQVSGSPIGGIAITIPPGIDLHGSIKINGPEGNETNLRSISLLLQPAADIATPEGPPKAVITADGAFVISTLSPNQYVWTLAGLPPGLYLKSLELGEEDVTSSTLDLTGGSSGALQVVLGANAGRVEGIVQGDAADATVVLVPDGARRAVAHWYRSMHPTQSGSFQMRDVAPGNYKLFAWTEVEEGVWMDPDFLKPFEDQGHAITVTEGGSQTVNLTLR